MTPATPVLLLPGWMDSGPGHWQTRWQALHGYERVQQSDWMWPRRGDWMARLEEVLLAHQAPAILVAHSLGCHLVAAWAAHSAHTRRVRGALLVAPPDLDSADTPPPVATWRPIVRQRLPFDSLLIYSENDPYCSTESAQSLALSWGCPARSLGAAGHINGESGLGPWSEGHALMAPWRR